MNSQSRPESERRQHQRFHLLPGLAAGPLVSLKTEGGVVLPVLNWSYGGLQMAVSRAGQVAVARLDDNETVRATLHLAVASEMSQKVNFKVVGTSENTLSCAFVHDTPDVLLFMRPWMECLRRGSSVTELTSDAIKPELAAAGWKIWRGEGPLTLSARDSARNDESSPPDWLLVFPLGEGYAEVGSTDGKLFSRQSIDNDGMASTRMQASNAKDVGLLNLALMYLAGCAAGSVPETLCAKIIDPLRRDP